MPIADILLSPVTVWYAPVGEPLPDENEKGFGEAWGGNWVNVGYTTTPLTMALNRETYEMMVEQLTTAVKRIVIKDAVDFETTLAEWTDGNMVLAFNGATRTITVAGPSQVGKTELEWGGSTTLDVYTWGFEALYKTDLNVSFPVRIFLYKGEAILNGTLAFAKNKEAGIPLKIASQPDTTKAAGKQIMLLQKVTAAATGTA